jgi:hypothetical protein
VNDEAATEKVELAGDCPRCGATMNDAISLDLDAPARPSAGDVGLCLSCAAPLQYTQDGSPRWLTYEELMEVAKTPENRGLLVAAICLIVTARPSRVQISRRAPFVENGPTSEAHGPA